MDNIRTEFDARVLKIRSENGWRKLTGEELIKIFNDLLFEPELKEELDHFCE